MNAGKKLPVSPRIAVFKGREIRKIIFNNEWWFSVVDVVAALTDSINPRDYWYKMKIREKEDAGIELSTICRQLKMQSADGKKYETDCANTEGIFRIIQSIPSPKAEPFKRWLAKVGYERVQEIEDPELAVKHMRAIYHAKGHSDEWIETRMRGVNLLVFFYSLFAGCAQSMVMINRLLLLPGRVALRFSDEGLRRYGKGGPCGRRS